MAEKLFFIFSANIGVRQPSRRAVRRNVLFYLIGVIIGVREPLKVGGCFEAELKSF